MKTAKRQLADGAWNALENRRELTMATIEYEELVAEGERSNKEMVSVEETEGYAILRMEDPGQAERAERRAHGPAPAGPPRSWWPTARSRRSS